MIFFQQKLKNQEKLSGIIAQIEKLLDQGYSQTLVLVKSRV